MTRYEQFADLVYLSRLKVNKLAETLPQPLASRVSNLQINVAGTGVGASVDPEGRSAIRKLPSVVDAICHKYNVRDYTDPDLSSGQWFVGDMRQMAYGPARWDWSPQDADVVFFTGTDLGVSVLLGGSVQHLLDRELAQDVARTGSTSERLRGVMAKVIAVEEDARDPRTVPTIHPWDECDLASSAHDSFQCIDSGLEEIAGRTPLKFLARVIDVFPEEGQSSRLVVGTPLYVAAWDEGDEAAAHSELAHYEPAQSGQGHWARSLRRLILRTSPQPSAPDRRATDGTGDSADGPSISALDVQALTTLHPLSTDAPSLDIELYIRPASVQVYANPWEYYEAHPNVSRGRITAAVGNRDLMSSDIHWYDDQRGAWLLSFSCADTLHRVLCSGTNATITGNLVATKVSRDGAGEVLVLAQDVPLHEVMKSLQGYQYAEPRLKWVVDHMSGT